MMIYLYTLFTSILAIIFWRVFSKKKIFKVYNSEHQIHSEDIPQIGGLVFFISLFFLPFSDVVNNDLKIYLCFILLFLIGLIDDLFVDFSNKMRLILQFLVVILFIYVLDSVSLIPFLDNPFLIKINDNNILRYIFFSIFVVGFINGMNFVDGMNGLIILISLCILFSLKVTFVNFLTPDEIVLINSLIIILFSILIFNFPKAYLFMGDSGAYLMGIIISYLTMRFFSTYNEVLSLKATVILFYPAMEVIFSVLRKIILKNNPLKADRNHLHTIIFNYFSKTFKFKIANPLSTITLVPLLSLPYLICSNYELNNLYSIIFSLIILFTVYVLYYSIFYKLAKKQ